MKLKLYYSVQSGGDGSAYPKFSLSEELVEIDQEIESEFREGWSENCTGYVELESDTDIKIITPKNLMTKESLLEGLQYFLEGGYKKSENVKVIAQDFVDQINAVK